MATPCDLALQACGYDEMTPADEAARAKEERGHERIP
jgi:hypothetical protein